MATLMEKAVEILGSVKTPELAAELVLRLAREAHFEEFEGERQRDLARTRKRKQRDIDRNKGVSEAGQQRDFGVTVPPSPPSGSVSDPVSGSPDPSEPDPEDPHDDGRPGPVSRYSSNFIQFWLAYPRKVGKEAAWRMWKRHVPPLPACLTALLWQRGTHKWRVERIIPNPATWINAHRWKDERDNSVTSAGQQAPAKTVPKTPPEARGWVSGGGR